MTQIVVQNLTKIFQGQDEDVVALGGVDLEIEDGEFVVLLGPSGCGKTTMLRSIAGLETPTDGEIRIGERTVFKSSRPGVNVPVERRNVGMVFQSYALWPNRTVERNVAYPLQRRKRPRREIAEAVAETLDLVQCGHLGGRYPNELSGGQQQRIALARALVSDPAVMLFDEPLSNLDESLREQMRHLIATVQQRVGCTAVYVTHDQREALALADRIVVMHNGAAVQVGPPEEIYYRPRSKYVARFMGAGNTLDVVDWDGSDVLETVVGGLRVEPAPAVARSGSHCVAIRSIDIRVVDVVETVTAAPATNLVQARLDGSEFQGRFRLGFFTTRDGVALRAALPVSQSLEVGSEHTLYLPPEKCHVVVDDTMPTVAKSTDPDVVADTPVAGPLSVTVPS